MYPLKLLFHPSDYQKELFFSRSEIIQAFVIEYKILFPMLRAFSFKGCCTMMRNSKREPGLVLGAASIVLLLGAWLLFPTATMPGGRLVFALLWLGFCAVPAVCYSRLMRESARRAALMQAEGQVRARLVATMQTEQQAHARLVAILEATPDLVAINDIQGKICYLNQAGRKMLGLEDAPPVPCADSLTSLPGIDVCDVADDLFPIGLEDGYWSGEKILKLDDGRKLPVSQVVIAHRGQNGRLDFLSTIARDITERKQLDAQMQEQLLTILEQKEALEQHEAQLITINARMARSYAELQEANRCLEALATTDGLTGLCNHRAFQQKLTEEFNRRARYRTPLSLMLIDVDKFKPFNDKYGHPAGDEVLKQVAYLLQSAARTTDCVARYGGEEFVIILPETDENGALEAAERIRFAIEQAPWQKRSITISAGLASLRPDTATPAMLIEEADKALYVSKEFGRNCVTHHDTLLNALVGSSRC